MRTPGFLEQVRLAFEKAIEHVLRGEARDFTAHDEESDNDLFARWDGKNLVVTIPDEEEPLTLRVSVEIVS